MLIPKWLIILFICLSFVGFLDAAYLTVEHYTQGILPCYVFKGCEKVTTSQYSTLAGVPISLFGAIYYLTIFISGILFLDTKSQKWLSVLGYLPILGFLASLGLIYLQLFVIKAICLYCVISAISSTTLFIMGLYLLRLKKSEKTLSSFS
jgi:uncharacterized membrane protein